MFHRFAMVALAAGALEASRASDVELRRPGASYTYETLAALHAIERAQGRVRGVRWGARTIDLDLVRYGERRIRTRALTLPHPGIASRDFWQRELAELARALGEVS